MGRFYKIANSIFKQNMFSFVLPKSLNTIKNNNKKMKTFFHAGIGVCGVHVISILPNIDDTQKIAEILVQIIIGAVTIYKILKKNG